MTVLLVITPLIVPLVITVMIVIVAMCGDKLLTKVDHHGIKAIIDSTTHGSVALFSWAVVVFNSNSIHDLKVFHCAEILGCGAIASLIDVDHFLAARSFRLQDALQLSRRPPFHSSSLLILVFFSLYLSAKQLDTLQLQVYWFSCALLILVVALFILVIILFVKLTRLKNEMIRKVKEVHKFNVPYIDPKEDLAKRGFAQYPQRSIALQH
ncbi:transmembrane protein 267 isoform X1 [Halyomorpha halys]|uniref:transmembrane protein 267 isoform X1 n=1 Tax=Halyomorpha halys TaxID=286706 RepID=UPI0006D4E4D4|nr:transmembrane protein 267 isoform X1 [Halyomorpha halys]